MKELRRFTTARVGLGRSGNSVPTRAVLDFALAHALARDAVHFPLDVAALLNDLNAAGLPAIAVNSAAHNRAEYLRRPDFGRRLDGTSLAALDKLRGQFDVVLVIADGLSALAVHNHAVAVLGHLIPLLSGEWDVAPVIVVRFGRVAVGDEIGSALDAKLAVVLIGERPGLSSPDSLGIYLTWDPRSGRRDSERNCISNIHDTGLSAGAAARLLSVLMNEVRTRKLSGIGLKAPPLNLLDEIPKPAG
jgi:ethanolamine ammonia-lyase small subunit